MAQVLFQGMDAARLIPRSQIRFTRRDPKKAKQNEQKYGITSTTLKTLAQTSDILLLGIRPDQAPLLLRDLALIGLGDKKIISILAGVKLAFFQKYLGPTVQLLRVMPNLASAVGAGMSVFTFSEQATREFKTAAHNLFTCCGDVLEVPEKHMDLACGLAGSGPGFVFRLIEAAARFGEKGGIPYSESLKMVAQTFAGAAHLILKGHLPANLIQQIAVPNGTTEAGFQVMKEAQMEKNFQAAIEAAARKSQEISEKLS